MRTKTQVGTPKACKILVLDPENCSYIKFCRLMIGAHTRIYTYKYHIYKNSIGFSQK